MSALLVSLALFLAQTEADPAASPTPAPAAADGTPAEAAPAAAPRPRGLSQEELQRQVDRLRKTPSGESDESVEALRTQLTSAPDPKAAPITDADAVKQVARLFFRDLISGDARGMTLLSGYPFQLEDRRLESPDELHKEWLKNLRAKRTDLFTLYDLEVLTPAEMEKKYGKPPARLSAIVKASPKTFVVVGNLSGHPAIAVVRSAPFGWQVVGFHD